MKIEIYQEYDENDKGIGPAEVFEVRRPLGRQIWAAQKLDPENMDTPEAWNVISKLLQETTVSAPKEYTNGSGVLDTDVLPADCFFELFANAMKAIARASKKLSQM